MRGPSPSAIRRRYRHPAARRLLQPRQTGTRPGGGPMSPVIDQAVTWRKVEERLAVETDPILRRNLEVLLAHMKAEMAADVDGLLDTLSDDVHYQPYGSPDPLTSPVGKDGVRGF